MFKATEIKQWQMHRFLFASTQSASKQPAKRMHAWQFLLKLQYRKYFFIIIFNMILTIEMNMSVLKLLLHTCTNKKVLIHLWWQMSPFPQWLAVQTEYLQVQIKSYHVCATVKRRRWRMLLLTSNLLNIQGEFLGELRGEIFGEVLLFPDSLGGSSSKCMCSLKVRMQDSGSGAVSSFEVGSLAVILVRVIQFLPPPKILCHTTAEKK